ncbi:MAG: response regulator transcription factor [Labilithrix sp.]|nr:response regulator transcription factor [Labilithrix sp.]MCW5816368.1 response regulator transcription factor [Labilithrix sp.]
MERVLIVEDDPPLRLAMTKALRAAGYEVTTAKTGDEGLEAALADPPDVVLLDVMLPGMNGYEVLAELRKQDPELPIVMITAKGEEADRVRGLTLGADEYVVKPVGLAELQARVGAALRRQRLATRQAPVKVGALLVDFTLHSATRDGELVEMTAHEMKLLEFFLRNEDAILPRQRILAAVWGAGYFGTDRTVDNFVNRLRAKIEPDPKEPVHLVTLRGAGYRFRR